MDLNKEWKKGQISNPQFNQEVYVLLDAALKKYKTNPPHTKYNDVRLVTREILDNIHKHGDQVFIIRLDIHVSENVATIKITHDGKSFDPFADENNCVLLKQLNYEYQFNSKFTATDAGRFSLTFKFDLSEITGSQNGII